MFITDFPLNRLSTLYWLATLARASYSPGPALFRQAAYAVAPSSTVVQFVPNAGGLTPGYGIIVFPQFLVCVVSGTTNLAQWLSQIFLNGLVATDYPLNGGNDTAMTMALYKSAADVIDTAIAGAAGNDRPVLLVGHSMGGAIASVLHYKYRQQTPARKVSRLVSFGSPKPGDTTLINGLRNGAQVMRRLTISGDPIPGLPPAIAKAAALLVPAPFLNYVQTWSAYGQAGALYYVDDNGAQSVGMEPNIPLFIAGALVTIGAGRFLSLPAPHLLSAYITRFRAGFGNNLPASETTRWSNPSVLQQVNDLLTAAGL